MFKLESNYTPTLFANDRITVVKNYRELLNQQTYFLKVERPEEEPNKKAMAVKIKAPANSNMR